MTDQHSRAPAFPPRLNPDLAPLTMQQQRAWFMENLQPGTPAFHLTSAHRLTGRLEEAVFERAFALLLQRHPALRTVIAVEDGEPVQRVLPEMPSHLCPAQDLSQMPAPECENWLERRLAALAAQPFDLTAGPLWRAQVFRLAPGEHVIFFMAHQIVWDSASFDLFCRDMAALYAALSQEQPVADAVPAAGPGDFAAWQREWLHGSEAAAQLTHWKELLQGGLELLDLPADKARPAVPSGQAGSLWIDFSRAEADSVQALAHRAGTTPFTVLLALFAALLQRMTQRQDLIIGTPALARRPGLETVLGSFANTLPLRLRVDPKAPLLALIETTRDAVKSAARHAELPFEHLVRELDLPRDASRSPVHQVAFSYHDLRVRPAHWGALQYRAQATPPAALAEDLTLGFSEHDEGLRGLLAYNADVFVGGSMALLGERFAHLVRLALDVPELAVESATAPSLGEQMRLKAWNATDAAYDRSATVGRLLEAVLHEPGVPTRTAVSSGSEVLSYAQLHGRAEQMARVLRARGIGRGRLVGLCVDRGVDMLVAQLAVLKSGAGYVPLDPAYPADRLAYMAEHSRLAALVTHSTLADTVPWPREHSLWLDQDQPAIAAQPTGPLPADDEVDAQPQDPAYVIYTSGSTGKPKGVAVPHGAVANFLLSMQREPRAQPGRRAGGRDHAELRHRGAGAAAAAGVWRPRGAGQPRAGDRRRATQGPAAGPPGQRDAGHPGHLAHAHRGRLAGHAQLQGPDRRRGPAAGPGPATAAALRPVVEHVRPDRDHRRGPPARVCSSPRPASASAAPSPTPRCTSSTSGCSLCTPIGVSGEICIGGDRRGAWATCTVRS